MDLQGGIAREDMFYSWILEGVGVSRGFDGTWDLIYITKVYKYVKVVQGATEVLNRNGLESWQFDRDIRSVSRTPLFCEDQALKNFYVHHSHTCNSPQANNYLDNNLTVSPCSRIQACNFKSIKVINSNCKSQVS